MMKEEWTELKQQSLICLFQLIALTNHRDKWPVTISLWVQLLFFSQVLLISSLLSITTNTWWNLTHVIISYIYCKPSTNIHTNTYHTIIAIFYSQPKRERKNSRHKRVIRTVTYSKNKGVLNSSGDECVRVGGGPQNFDL